MKAVLVLVGLCVLGWQGASPAAGHVFGQEFAAHLTVDGSVTVSTESLELHFVQRFRGVLFEKMWQVTDTDGDGIVTPAERVVCLTDDRLLVPAILELRLDWIPREPVLVENSFRGLPTERPADFSAVPPLEIHYQVRYDLPLREGVHLLSLTLDLKAKTIETKFTTGPGVLVRRVNTGRVVAGQQGVEAMIQRKNVPPSLGLLVEVAGPAETTRRAHAVVETAEPGRSARAVEETLRRQRQRLAGRGEAPPRPPRRPRWTRYVLLALVALAAAGVGLWCVMSPRAPSEGR